MSLARALLLMAFWACAAPGVRAAVPAPRDRPYPGRIELAVDASDVQRRVVHVHEVVTGLAGDAVLAYPKWLPGTHAPQGPIDRLAGLRLSAGGRPLAWQRDTLEVYALHVQVPAGVPLEMDFDYLSPVSPAVGPAEASDNLLMVEWNALLFYPSGWYVHRIPVAASLTLPEGWQHATALEQQGDAARPLRFREVPLDVFIDSPLYAGRHALRLDLDPGAAVPVHLDLFADRPKLLEVGPGQLQAYRNLVQQAYALYGARHYAHYDFLFSLSDRIQQVGLEHHQSSENGSDPETFTAWEKTAYDRDLLPHEFTHSWNGKFRRPADLWTPDYTVPMQDSLLWVYEGQTQYWGKVLAARAGLRTLQQALDDWALTAAAYARKSGRSWRPLQDTTSDEIINPRRPQSWPDWQRFEDYYSEGALIWLEADTLIRERSSGRRSLDDFARAFFGVRDGDAGELTYTFADVTKALGDVQGNDWAAFLRSRIDEAGRPAPLRGIEQGGYRLVYREVPNDLQKATEEQTKEVDLADSLGLSASAQDGSVQVVWWGSPAFKAGLTSGMQLVAVDGEAWSPEALRDAVQAAKGAGPAVQLIARNGPRYLVVSVDYHDGLRYPHLERIEGTPARLDDLLAPRK